jgi:CRP-like cAMP-binding protein
MAPPSSELKELSPATFDADGPIDMFPWSLDLDAKQLDRMVEYMTAYSAKAGQNLLHEGERGTYMGLILTGEVHVLKQDSMGRSKVIAVLGPGKMIGEMGLIDGGPRSASAVACLDTTLLVMTNVSFRQMTDEQPRLALKVMMTMAKIGSQRLRQTSGQLIELMPERIVPPPFGNLVSWAKSDA